jgi:hypothetical protein
LEEIKEWGVVDHRRHRIILKNAKQRREAYEMQGTSEWPLSGRQFD